MPLSSYRKHRIYVAATMNYGLGCDDPEELAYYNKIRKEIEDFKKEPVKKGVPLNQDILVWIKLSPNIIHIQIELLILYP